MINYIALLCLLFFVPTGHAKPCSLKNPVYVGDVRIEEIYANKMSPVKWKNAVFSAEFQTEEIDPSCKGASLGVDLFGIWEDGRLLGLGGASIYSMNCGGTRSFTGFDYGYLNGPWGFQGSISHLNKKTAVYEAYYFERTIKPGEAEAPLYRMLMHLEDRMVTFLEVTVPVYKRAGGMLMEYTGRNETVCLESAEPY